MPGTYKCTNVKFNMADPLQKEAYRFLQDHKGDKSYGHIISEAIMQMNDPKESDPSIQDNHSTVRAQFVISDDELKKLAEYIAANLPVGEVVPSGPLPGLSDDTLSDAMAAFAFE